MADEWMSAREAYGLAREAVGAAHAASAIFDHVASGLIEVKADKVTVEDAYGEIRQAESVHPKFWSHHHAAKVDQMWSTSTLRSFIPEDIGDGAYAWMGGPAKVETWQAFGVKFNREQVISYFSPEIARTPKQRSAANQDRKKPPLPDGKLRRWKDSLGSKFNDLGYEQLVDLVRKKHPNNFISRQRVRDLGAGRKKGPKQKGGKATAQ